MTSVDVNGEGHVTFDLYRLEERHESMQAVQATLVNE